MKLEDVRDSDAEAFAAAFINATHGGHWMTLHQARQCIVDLWEHGWELKDIEPEGDE